MLAVVVIGYPICCGVGSPKCPALATDTDVSYLLLPSCVAGGSRPTLTRVQVGLVSLARELKYDLDSIAARADTSSSRGLHHLLQGELSL